MEAEGIVRQVLAETKAKAHLPTCNVPHWLTLRWEGRTRPAEQWTTLRLTWACQLPADGHWAHYAATPVDPDEAASVSDGNATEQTVTLADFWEETRIPVSYNWYGPPPSERERQP